MVAVAFGGVPEAGKSDRCAIAHRFGFLTGIIYLLAIAVLPHARIWQFLTTGAVMAEVQWDMRSPIEYSLLTVEQQQFNQEQQQLRQMDLQPKL